MPGPERQSAITAYRTCFNCGAALHGPYCSDCGQRDRAPNPTLGEVLADAWEHVSGWDSRFLRTVRLLIAHPGALTREVLRGRRAAYITPFRLYLVASVLYFLLAASAPSLRRAAPTVTAGASGVTVDLLNPDNLTDAERKQVLEEIDRAPGFIRKLLQAAALDPVGFRQRFFGGFPRAMFGLVPLCAALLALFFRGRRYPQHLVFALHLHAAVFIVLGIRELAKFSGSLALVGVVEVLSLVWLLVYGTAAVMRVYEEGLVRTAMKMAGAGVLYGFALVAAVGATLAWTVMF